MLKNGTDFFRNASRPRYPSSSEPSASRSSGVRLMAAVMWVAPERLVAHRLDQQAFENLGVFGLGAEEPRFDRAAARPPDGGNGIRAGKGPPVGERGRRPSHVATGVWVGRFDQTGAADLLVAGGTETRADEVAAIGEHQHRIAIHREVNGRSRAVLSDFIRLPS